MYYIYSIIAPVVCFVFVISLNISERLHKVKKDITIIYFFLLKLSLRVLAKIAEMARLTSPLLFLSSCTQASLEKPMAIMFATSLSSTPEAGAEEAAGAGEAFSLAWGDSLVSMLLPEADLK